jgi:hypothetical protein
MKINPAVREGRVMAAAFGGGLAATRVELIPLDINQPTTVRRITALAKGAARIMAEVLMVADTAAVSGADTID